jgi:hypothetical protein
LCRKGDLEVGNNITSKISFVNVTTAGVTLVGGADDRVRLLIGSPAANRITISTEPTPVADQGINLYAGGNPLALDKQESGSIVRGPLFAIATTADQLIGIVESFGHFNGR